MPEVDIEIIRPLKRKKNIYYQKEDAWDIFGVTLNRDIFIPFTCKYLPPYGGKQAVINQYIGPYSVSSSAITPVTNRVYYLPVQIPYSLRLVELSVYVTTREDDKQAKLGLYSFERGRIRDYIFHNLIALNSIGVRTTPVNIALSPGTYMFVYFGNSITAAVRGLKVSDTILGYLRNDDAIINYYYYEDKSSFNDEFINNPSVILDNNSTPLAPHIYAKVG